MTPTIVPTVTIKQLLEAGVHFGHQTKRWNPKMKPYIFGERNGIYIIDLQKTLRLVRSALEFITGMAAQGKIVLFVGTKRQAQESIAEEARRCNMFYVNQRWLGGLLTNFSTIQKSIQRLRELEGMKENGQYDLLSKKEVSRLERERKKLEKYLFGIKEMPTLPDILFIIDTSKEAIAIREAKRLGIPVIGVVDTNCDPELIDYVIPGNDDALKSVRLITSLMAQAVIAGRQLAMASAETAEEQAALDAEGAPTSIPATGAYQPPVERVATRPPSVSPRPDRAAAPGGPRPRGEAGRRTEHRGGRAAPGPLGGGAAPGRPAAPRGRPPAGRSVQTAGGPAEAAKPRRPERAPGTEPAAPADALIKTTAPATSPASVAPSPETSPALEPSSKPFAAADILTVGETSGDQPATVAAHPVPEAPVENAPSASASDAAAPAEASGGTASSAESSAPPKPPVATEPSTP